MVGQRDNGTKGHLCFRFFNSDKNGLLKLLYILLIYILIIYIIIHIRPFAVLPHSFLTMQKPFVPMSHCPIVPFFLSYPLFLLNRLRGKPFNHIQVLRGTMGQRDKGTFENYTSISNVKRGNEKTS